jgi:hypothetical protein
MWIRVTGTIINNAYNVPERVQLYRAMHPELFENSIFLE